MARCEFYDACGYRKLCQNIVDGSVKTHNDLKILFKDDKKPQELALKFLDYFCEGESENCRHHESKRQLGDIVR